MRIKSKMSGAKIPSKHRRELSFRSFSFLDKLGAPRFLPLYLLKDNLRAISKKIRSKTVPSCVQLIIKIAQTKMGLG
jgi:hypothetical protein